MMKEIWLIAAALALFAFGGFVMKQLDMALNLLREQRNDDGPRA